MDILGLERGVPLSKAAVTYLTEDGVIKADDPAVSGLKLAQSLPTALPVSLTSTIRRSSPSSAPPCSTSTTVKSVEEAAEDFSARPTAFCAARCANLPVGNLRGARREGRRTALSEEIFKAHPGAVAFIGIPLFAAVESSHEA